MSKLPKSLQNKAQISVYLVDCEFRFDCPNCGGENTITATQNPEGEIGWFLNQMHIEKSVPCEGCGESILLHQKPNMTYNQYIRGEVIKR